MGFRAADVPMSLEGFGYLSPRRRRANATCWKSVQWCSSIFPGRAPAGDGAIAALLCGGWNRPEIVDWDDDRLLTAVRGELCQAMRVRAAPVFLEISSVGPKAIPQYHLGHLERVAWIEERAGRHPGLYLGGNAYHGVAINDCVEQAGRPRRNACAWAVTPAQVSGVSTHFSPSLAAFRLRRHTDQSAVPSRWSTGPLRGVHCHVHAHAGRPSTATLFRRRPPKTARTNDVAALPSLLDDITERSHRRDRNDRRGAGRQPAAARSIRRHARHRYLHSSRTIHQLDHRPPTTGPSAFISAVASLLYTASTALLNAEARARFRPPRAHRGVASGWCLPVTFGVLTVLALFVGLLLVRTASASLCEVAKMNVLLGLPGGRVSASTS